MNKDNVINRKGKGFVLGALNKLVNWSRAESLWVYPCCFGCCSIEIKQLASSSYDVERFGILFKSNPKQSDVLLVAGPIRDEMAEHILQVYDQMPRPRYVISVGSCANSGGGNYSGSYVKLRKCDEIIPVDVYISGCPPTAKELLNGLLRLKQKIKSQV